MRVPLISLLAGAVVSVALGCSGGGGNGGGGGGDDDDDDDGGSGIPGGYISITSGTIGGYDIVGGNAEFYTSVGTAGLLSEERLLSAIPLDGCSTEVITAPDATVTHLDVGPTVTIQSNGFMAVMTRSTSGGTVTYSVLDLATVPVGAPFDVVLSGAGPVPGQTWTAELSIPPAPEILIPAPLSDVDLTSAPALDVTWTPGSADHLIVGFTNDMIPTTSYVRCRAADDGAFTVPSEVIAALPVGAGSIVFTATDDRTHVLDGRDVLLLGHRGTEVSYDR